MINDNPFSRESEQPARQDTSGPLIFLGFDGVVHKMPDGGLPSYWDSGVLPLLGIRFFLAKPMQQVFRICDAVGGRIVLTTSWRSAFQISELNQVFRGQIVGKTPDRSGNMGEQGLREREINAYLDGCDEAVRYAIIDARADNFVSNDLNLFLTNPAKCITDELADQVIQSLS
ncbi:MAG: HAD domain-containing protein [Chromatiales bacterium]|nr:HAD domain-containing protein [Chromatiales bacterium]